MRYRHEHFCQEEFFSLRSSKPSAHKHHSVTGFKSGVKAARQSLWYGWKDGVTGIVKEPLAGYKRHGTWGGAGGALLGTVNVLVKPATATLSSITWLSRGTYATLRKAVKDCDTNQKRLEKRRSTSIPSSPMTGFRQEHVMSVTSVSDNEDDGDGIEITQAAPTAAADSGFHPKICQYILNEFMRIKSKKEHSNSTSAIPSEKIVLKPIHL